MKQSSLAVPQSSASAARDVKRRSHAATCPRDDHLQIPTRRGQAWRSRMKMKTGRGRIQRSLTKPCRRMCSLGKCMQACLGFYAGAVLELFTGVRNSLPRSKCSTSFAAPLYLSGPSESGKPSLCHFVLGRGASQHFFLSLLRRPGCCTGV